MSDLNAKVIEALKAMGIGKAPEQHQHILIDVAIAGIDNWTVGIGWCDGGLLLVEDNGTGERWSSVLTADYVSLEAMGCALIRDMLGLKHRPGGQIKLLPTIPTFPRHN